MDGKGIFATTVKAKNIETIKSAIHAPDQADKIKIGDFISTWPISVNNQRGQITVWHKTGRAAVSWGGESQWGEWSEDAQDLRLDRNGETIDSSGERMGI